MTPATWTRIGNIRTLLQSKWNNSVQWKRSFVGSGKPGGGTKGWEAKHDMNIVPSRWYWEIFKDRVNLWILLTGAPLLGFTVYMNLTVGPAP